MTDPLSERLEKAAVDNFWSKVDKNGPIPEMRPDLGSCWVWMRSKRRGYGRFFRTGNLPVSAHRFAYECLIGPIPSGLQADHLCRNKSCVRPSHIELVTARENTLRGIGYSAQNARKIACPNGHLYDSVNKKGARFCKQCSNEKQRTMRSQGRWLSHGWAKWTIKRAALKRALKTPQSEVSK